MQAIRALVVQGSNNWDGWFLHEAYQFSKGYGYKEGQGGNIRVDIQSHTVGGMFKACNCIEKSNGRIQHM